MGGAIWVAMPLGVAAFVIWLLLKTILRWREISRETRIMSQLVAQVENAEEAARFLESSGVRTLFERMIDQRTLVLERVLRAVQAGIVLVILGIAIFVIRSQLTDGEAMAALVYGTLSCALGLAFLLAAGTSYALSVRWGLVKEAR
jgi:hypothetical protein